MADSGADSKVLNVQAPNCSVGGADELRALADDLEAHVQANEGAVTLCCRRRFTDAASALRSAADREEALRAALEQIRGYVVVDGSQFADERELYAHIAMWRKDRAVAALGSTEGTTPDE